MPDLDLGQLRTIFPGWPSELDVAKQAANWSQMAQCFRNAGEVLRAEQAGADRDFHASVGQSVDPDVLARLQIGPASLYCMAFSLELAIKAALVKQGCLDSLESGNELPFSSHRLVAFARKVDLLNLSEAEEECLEQAEAMIMTGRYPVAKRPNALVNGVRAVSRVDDFADTAMPLFERLQSLATEGEARQPLSIDHGSAGD